MEEIVNNGRLAKKTSSQVHKSWGGGNGGNEVRKKKQRRALATQVKRWAHKGVELGRFRPNNGREKNCRPPNLDYSGLVGTEEG